MLQLYNSLTRQKEAFSPLKSAVGMYVCGPTVYDRPHVGNARAVVVYDVLFRLLKQLYPKVIYVRNITDVDDKINAAAKANNEPIAALTERITALFHQDMAALNNELPTHEPRATAHIPQMIAMIEALIQNGHAYAAEGHVLFDVTSYEQYGALSGRSLDELMAGARIEVESYKKNPGDFVLWKPSEADEPGWQSPWGFGRPGWHIECSAMSTEYLGQDFDIHGGGADLKFPHHENEIAQSCCAKLGSHYAKIWVHNGFVTVNGEKMSKSLGNFTTVSDLLEKGVKGEVIRYVLLAAHYRKPLDFTDRALEEAKRTLDKWYELPAVNNAEVPSEFLDALLDDMNTPLAFSIIHALKDAGQKAAALSFLGFLQTKKEEWFDKKPSVDTAWVQEKMAARAAAKKNKNFAEADTIRAELAKSGILLEDTPSGTIWKHA